WVNRSRKVISRHLHRIGYAIAVDERDALVGERRQEPADRVVELEPPFLLQHHNGHRGDWLCHRVDAKDRVRRDRCTSLLVREPAHPQCATCPRRTTTVVTPASLPSVTSLSRQASMRANRSLH